MAPGRVILPTLSVRQTGDPGSGSVGDSTAPRPGPHTTPSGGCMTEAILHEALWRIGGVVMMASWAFVLPPGRLRNFMVAVVVTGTVVGWRLAWGP